MSFKWTVFDAIEISIDIPMLIFIAILILMYRNYISYVIAAYDLSNKHHNRVIEGFPKLIIKFLIVFGILVFTSCKWI